MALYPTQAELDTLASKPTLYVGQCCDCKVDTGDTRIWLCRVEGGITMESLTNGKWIIARGSCTHKPYDGPSQQSELNRIQADLDDDPDFRDGGW